MNALHRMERFLDAHPHSLTSAETVRVAGVPATRIAKGVLLNGVDCQMVAMIPADQEVHLGRLGLDHGEEFSLADEASVSRPINLETSVGCARVCGFRVIWQGATTWRGGPARRSNPARREIRAIGRVAAPPSG